MTWKGSSVAKVGGGGRKTRKSSVKRAVKYGFIFQAGGGAVFGSGGGMPDVKVQAGGVPTSNSLPGAVRSLFVWRWGGGGACWH